MTTHLRARAVQAGAFLALAGGVIAAVPSVALAADPQVGISSLSSGDIPSGGKATMTYTIANRNVGNPNAAEPVTVVVSAEGMSCSGKCNFNDTINPGQSKSFTATLTAGTVEAGETRRVQVQINATIGEDSGSASRAITVRGPDKPKTVREVSGRVRDQEGTPVGGANVALQDSAGKSFNTTTGSDGRYSIKGSESNPIAVGRIVVGAIKQGYQTATQTVQGGADKSINVPLTIRLTAATTSPTPSPSATPSATPTEEVTDEESEAVAEEDTAAAAAPDPKNTSGEDEGNSSLLFILLGGLLVAAGIGAIVLVLMRRKNSDPDDPDLKGAGAIPPPSRGFSGADQTRVASPMAGLGSDATMIAPRSGSPSIADAPTMIHRTPVPDPVDEFPDPYGAPLPQNGAYNAPGGFGSTAAGAAGAAGAYGTATQYGGAPVPAQGAGYDDADADGYAAYDDRAGYDDQGGYAPAATPPRYDEPTGMYRPDPSGFEDPATYPDRGGYRADQGYDDGYGQGDDYAGGAAGRQSGAYAAGGGYQAGGYGQPDDDQGAYGSWDAPDGMDSGNAYGPPAGGGTYGGAPGGGTYGGGAPAGGGTYGGAQGAGTYGGGAPAGGGTYGASGAYGGNEDDYADGYDQRGGGTYGGGQGGGAYGGGAQPGGGPYGGTYGADQRGGGTYGGEPGQRGGRRQQPPPEDAQPGPRRPIDWMDD